MYTTGLKLPLVETSIYFPGYGHSATQDENIMWQQSAINGHRRRQFVTKPIGGFRAASRHSAFRGR
jgi:hypothetical protein